MTPIQALMLVVSNGKTNEVEHLREVLRDRDHENQALGVEKAAWYASEKCWLDAEDLWELRDRVRRGGPTCG